MEQDTLYTAPSSENEARPNLTETQQSHLREKEKNEYWSRFLAEIAHKSKHTQLARLLFLKQETDWEMYDGLFQGILTKEAFRQVKGSYRPAEFIAKAKNYIVNEPITLTDVTIEAIVKKAIHALAREADMHW